MTTPATALYTILICQANKVLGCVCVSCLAEKIVLRSGEDTITAAVKHINNSWSAWKHCMQRGSGTGTGIWTMFNNLYYKQWLNRTRYLYKKDASLRKRNRRKIAAAWPHMYNISIVCLWTTCLKHTAYCCKKTMQSMHVNMIWLVPMCLFVNTDIRNSDYIGNLNGCWVQKR